jgi:hypothetical protein
VVERLAECGSRKTKQHPAITTPVASFFHHFPKAYARKFCVQHRAHATTDWWASHG